MSDPIRIVAIGNCQASEVAKTLERAFRHHRGLSFSSVASYSRMSADDKAKLQDVDILLAQVGAFADEVVEQAAAQANSVVRFPALSMNALWPFATEPHPSNRSSKLWPAGPFPKQGGNKWINQQMAQGMAPEAALKAYEGLDVAAETRVKRLLQMDVVRWKSLEKQCRISFADDLYARIPRERTFHAPLHPTARTLEPIIDGVIRNSPLSGLSQASWRGAPESFFRNQPPIHPSIGEALGLEWLPKGYNLWDMGPVSQREWLRRYVNYDGGADVAVLLNKAQAATTRSAYHKELLAAVKEARLSVPLRIALAFSHMERNEPDRASLHAERASLLWPGVAEPIFIKVKIAAQQQDWEAVDRIAAELLAIDPWHLGGHLFSTTAKMKAKDHDGAWRAVIAAQDSYPDSPRIAALLAKVKRASSVTRERANRAALAAARAERLAERLAARDAARAAAQSAREQRAAKSVSLEPASGVAAPAAKRKRAPAAPGKATPPAEVAVAPDTRKAAAARPKAGGTKPSRRTKAGGAKEKT